VVEKRQATGASDADPGCTQIYKESRTMAVKTGTAEIPNRHFVATRELGAPASAVFKAWTDPKQLAQWWGPKGFTNPVCEFEAWPGGAIHIVMRGPDGVVYPMNGVVQEVADGERLVFASTAFEDEQGNPRLEDITTVTFAEHDGRTKLALKTEVIKAGSPEVIEALKGMPEGWSQSLDRLSELISRGR
jgi:uncharacterized protein YndB with AHSA1/START domain